MRVILFFKIFLDHNTKMSIAFCYGAILIPIKDDTMYPLMDAIVQATQDTTRVHNLENFIDERHIDEFNTVFKKYCKLPTSKHPLRVWIDYGPEDYTGPIRIRAISVEAMKNPILIPYEVCHFVI